MGACRCVHKSDICRLQRLKFCILWISISNQIYFRLQYPDRLRAAGTGCKVGGKYLKSIASKEPQAPVGAAETAGYIAGLAKELRELALKSNLGFLSYLLAMVEQEAAEAVRAAASKTPPSR